ncbi:UNVERIFIED_CONTAM: hypothetical protein K2H54_060132 [Gekko kuhli]
MAATRKNVRAKGDDEAARETAEENPTLDIEIMRLKIELARIEAEKELQMARLQAEERERQLQAEERERERRSQAEERERQLQAEERERQLQAEERERERRSQAELYQLKLQEIQLRAEVGRPERNSENFKIVLKRFPRKAIIPDDDLLSFLPPLLAKQVKFLERQRFRSSS